MPQREDSGRQDLQRQLAGLKGLVEPLKPLPNVTQLGVYDLQPAGQLTGHSVDLLRHQRHQLDDGLLGENALPDLLDHKVLNPGSVQVAGAARPCAFPEQGAADVVGELAALGSLGGVGPAADTALEQPAQQEPAPNPRWPLHLGGTVPHRLLHGVELLPGHQRGPSSLNPHRDLGLLSLAGSAPHGGAGVGFVGQQVVESSLVPAVAPVGDAPVVQGLAYLHEAVPPKRALEQLLHHRSGGRVNLQRGTLLHPVADLDAGVAERGLGAEEEAA